MQVIMELLKCAIIHFLTTTNGGMQTKLLDLQGKPNETADTSEAYV
jgi:hypothetical protein